MDYNGINKKIDKLNIKYEYNGNKGYVPYNLSEVINFKIYRGTIPILLSAPHAVVQYRNSAMKEADEYTGAIVEYLCQKTGAWGIIREWYAKDDPNYNSGRRSTFYRDNVVKLIEQNNIYLLLDIHGYSKKNHINIASKKIVVGTGFGKNINRNINLNREFIEVFGDELIFDKPFSATLPNNVSSYAHSKTGISAYQCELERICRISSRERVEMLEKLSDFISDVSETYEVKTK